MVSIVLCSVVMGQVQVVPRRSTEPEPYEIPNGSMAKELSELKGKISVKEWSDLLGEEMDRVKAERIYQDFMGYSGTRVIVDVKNAAKPEHDVLVQFKGVMEETDFQPTWRASFFRDVKRVCPDFRTSGWAMHIASIERNRAGYGLSTWTVMLLQRNDHKRIGYFEIKIHEQWQWSSKTKRFTVQRYFGDPNDKPRFKLVSTCNDLPVKPKPSRIHRSPKGVVVDPKPEPVKEP